MPLHCADDRHADRAADCRLAEGGCTVAGRGVVTCRDLDILGDDGDVAGWRQHVAGRLGIALAGLDCHVAAQAGHLAARLRHAARRALPGRFDGADRRLQKGAERAGLLAAASRRAVDGVLRADDVDVARRRQHHSAIGNDIACDDVQVAPGDGGDGAATERAAQLRGALRRAVLLLRRGGVADAVRGQRKTAFLALGAVAFIDGLLAARDHQVASRNDRQRVLRRQRAAGDDDVVARLD